MPPTDEKPQEDAQADGYYGEDEMGSEEELDLSFLDDEEKSDQK
jgi:hypothetical protein